MYGREFRREFGQHKEGEVFHLYWSCREVGISVDLGGEGIDIDVDSISCGSLSS
jgi:hypothetical protein